MTDDVTRPPSPADEPLIETPPDSAAATEVEAFAAETAEADSLATGAPADFRDRWLRAEADLQNFRRRAARDREESVRASEDRLLTDVLDVLDDLERALGTLEAERREEPWAQGVALTAQRLRDVLARAGVTAIDTAGQRFDPVVHEALLEIEAPEGVSPGHVAQEIRRGYRRGDRTLRAARVVVARGA